MGDKIYRLYYIQRGRTEWEFEDFYTLRARREAALDARNIIVAVARAEGTEDELPDEPEMETMEVIYI